MPRRFSLRQIFLSPVMLRSLCGFFLLVFLFGCSPSGGAEKIPPEEIPMYGYDKRTIPPEEQEIHDVFIREIIAASGSREAAIHDTLYQAWKQYRAGDRKAAMKRLNQAWLLDPNNAEVFLGFALLVPEKDTVDKAIAFCREALSRDPQHSLVMANLAVLYIRKATKLIQQHDNIRETEYRACLNEAENLLQKALQLTPSDDDKKMVGYLYYKWAVVLAMREDFKGAWEKVHLSQTHGGQIDPGFIENLSRRRLEPSG